MNRRVLPAYLFEVHGPNAFEKNGRGLSMNKPTPDPSQEGSERRAESKSKITSKTDSRFMVQMHAGKRKVAVQGPTHHDPSQEGRRGSFASSQVPSSEG
jgi:hypothetical protein